MNEKADVMSKKKQGINTKYTKSQIIE